MTPPLAIPASSPSLRTTVHSGEPGYPSSLTSRLGHDAPPVLTLLGNANLLSAPLTALFCSEKAPGSAILHAHDAARRLRDEGRTVISGFQSQIERQCLRILLRGDQPIIVGPGRSIDRMRVPVALRPALEEGRLLFVSPFQEGPRRVTRESASRRNDIIAALAEEAFIAHATPGGEAERISGLFARWGVRVLGSGLSPTPRPGLSR